MVTELKQIIPLYCRLTSNILGYIYAVLGSVTLTRPFLIRLHRVSKCSSAALSVCPPGFFKHDSLALIRVLL